MHFVPTDVDLEFVPESEDIHLGGVDGVEDEGEDQGQEEGRPASHQQVADGNLIRVVIISHNGQNSQARKQKIFENH